MKKLIIIFLLFAGTVSAQTMLVTKTEVKTDPAWQVLKNNYQPLSDYLSKEISECMIKGDSIRADHLVKVKRKIWAAIREFRNETIDSTVTITEVDSLKTIQIIQRNASEIKVLKQKLTACPECDMEVLQSMINTLQNQRNEAVKHSKNWVKKKEDANTNR